MTGDFITLSLFTRVYLEVKIRPEEVIAVEDFMVKDWPWDHGTLASRITLRGGARIVVEERSEKVMEKLLGKSS